MDEGPWPGVAGKTVVITGATNGIGLAAAKALAARGANVGIVARDRQRGEVAAQMVRASASSAGRPSTVDVLVADLGIQAQTRRLAGDIAEKYARLDVLVNNAGAVFVKRQLTVEGVELTWAVNHLGPFLLTTLLLDLLSASSPARVITTSSDASAHAHIPFDDLDGGRSWGSSSRPDRGFRRYGETKLANIVFTMELARRLEGTGVDAYCFHPGFVATGFNKHNGALMRFGMAVAGHFGRSPEKGAETLVWLASVPVVPGPSGSYFSDLELKDVPAGALEPDVQQRLWDVSTQQTQRPQPGL